MFYSIRSMSFIYLLLAKFGMRLTVMQVLDLKIAGDNEKFKLHVDNDSEINIIIITWKYNMV